MAQFDGFQLAQSIALAAGLVVQSTLAVAEAPVGSSVESRITVAFTVDGTDLDPWLPEGWAPVAFPGGPLSGANLLMVLADQQAQTDAEGKPKEPSAKRFVVFAGLGRETEGEAVRFFAYRVYSSDVSEDPYGNASLAAVTRNTATSVEAEGGRQRREDWSISPADDTGTLTLSLEFTSGRTSWAPSEANPYSNRIEGFNRIYRYRQLVDLAMSAPLGKALAGEIDYSSDIAELVEILDGSETLVAILDTPVYTREIFLP